ncbi:hypothetical protein ACMFMG_006658 [Clarireedia jacksonii]
MSGIPIHTNAPINAQSGSTHSTSPAETSAYPTSTSTSTSTSSSTYAAARPGASVPAPTSSSSAAAKRYLPTTPSSNPAPTPTRTIKDASSDVPPPPQPGAVPKPATGLMGPIPSTASPAAPAPLPTASAFSSSIPPPHLPHQMAIPPPQLTNPPPRSTTTANTPSMHSLPISLPVHGDATGTGTQPPPTQTQRQSLEHPPGYQQNVYAAELPSAHQHQHHNLPHANYNSNYSGINTAGGAQGARADDEQHQDGEAEGFWNNAKKWAESAGEKLSAGEKEVWRRIGK